MNIDSTLIDSTLDAALEEFKGSGRIVIVGASLAGLRAAETLREEGFRGHLTIIGDEPYEPYDRPPLSKQVLKGRCRPTGVLGSLPTRLCEFTQQPYSLDCVE